jgi:putative colanic acid biosynthesis acetyltransferase WcaB
METATGARITASPAGLLAWVFQDWAVNRGSPVHQALLAWFRLAQWARRRWGIVGRLTISAPYSLITALLLSMELPTTVTVGPRLRLHHKHAIVINSNAVIGSDCQLRQGVCVGNKTDRNGKDLGTATIGNGVDFGAHSVVIGPIHVGDHARIGALAVVTKSVPDFGVVVGNPGRVIRVDGHQDANTTQQGAIC